MIRAAVLLALCVAAPPALATDLPSGFVRLADLAPHIAQDIRYARAFNFTGAPVPGYDRESCILTETTAQALIRVETQLAQQGYGLVVFDCYRPIRSVLVFADWAAQSPAPPGGPPSQQTFFPDLARGDLIPLGYIARQSGHSVGHTVDVGLRRADQPPARPDWADATACTAAFDQRYAETGLDLGTGFDCFSPLSAVAADVTPEARKNRRILTRAMEAQGFTGYAAEWWHFRNSADPARDRQDFPVN